MMVVVVVGGDNGSDVNGDDGDCDIDGGGDGSIDGVMVVMVVLMV